MRQLAAILILISQALLLWVTFQPTGQSAIAFSFLGAPALGTGVLAGLVALEQRRRRERGSRPKS